LKEGGRAGGAGPTSQRLAGWFVAAQLACTVVLLTGIGLLTRSIFNIYRQATGFDSGPVLTMRLRLNGAACSKEQGRERFQTERLAALHEVAGVGRASITSHLPLGGSVLITAEPEGHAVPAGSNPDPVAALTVSPEYFQTFGIPVAAGRLFLGLDGQPEQATAIVNQRFAAKYWPGSDAVGRRVRIKHG
jgi:putative ABC transport system permease protein